MLLHLSLSNRQKIFEGAQKILTLLCGPQIGFYKVRKLYQSWNNWANWNQWFNQCTNGIQGGPQVIWQRTPIQRISAIPLRFHLKKWQRQQLIRDSSSKSETARGSYLGPELYNFVEIFEFYLVAQSLLVIIIEKYCFR